MIDVLVIGTGPAGCTAAIYCARAGRSVKMIVGPQSGGQLTIASLIENYPGFVEPIEGPKLMSDMVTQAERMGVQVESDTITGVDFHQNPFICHGERRDYQSKSVIIATGASAKWLGLASEEQYRGRGVSACATCDGFFFKNKTVAVVGGGNTAISEALYLTNFASKVYLIHRRDVFRCEKVLQDRVKEHPKIELLLNNRVEEIIGNETRVTGIKLADVKNNRNSTVELDGVFIAIGHTPASEIFRNQIAIDSDGYIMVNESNRETSVPGIFAAGDVCNKVYRQAVIAAGQGCIAAMSADKYLESCNVL